MRVALTVAVAGLLLVLTPIPAASIVVVVVGTAGGVVGLCRWVGE